MAEEQLTRRAVVVKSAEDSFTLGGYGVVYGGADLVGDTFTKDTDFWMDRLSATPPVLYQHGQDKTLKRRVLGRAAVEPRDVGLWVETQVSLADDYAEAIRKLAEEGKLGWSSGAVGHLVEYEGKTIKSWPIAEFSLTPTPAEPRTLGVRELRSLAELEPGVKGLLPEEGAEPSAGETAVAAEPEPIVVSDRTKELDDMAEETKVAEPQAPPVDVAALVKAAVEDAVGQTIEAMKQVPAVERQFNTQPEGTDRPEVKDFGDWCIAVQRGDVKRLKSVYGSVKAELSETSGGTGGYLVPPEYSQEILRVATEGAIVRPRARIIPMRSREWNVPALSYDGTTAGQPHSLGGVVATWTEEGGTKTETEPTFDTVKLVYHELSGYTVATNMLRLDAGETLSAMLTGLFGEAIRWYEDYAFLRGTGSTMPLGVLESDCLLTEVAASSTFVLSDMANMLAKFMSRETMGGVWVMHPLVLPKLIELADGAANTNNIIWIPNAREKEPASLFGRPVLFSEKMPAMPAGNSAAQKGGVLLADFSYYLVGSRQQIQIDFSEHFKFTENKGTWRFVELVDGQPWMKTYRTLADGSTTMSPFITLSGA